MQFDYFRFEGGTKKLSDWEMYKVSGKDAYKFFQGQLTNDLSSLKLNESQLTCRLNRNGHLVTYFYLAQKKDFFLLLIPKTFSQKTLDDLSKFIIMEEVEITPLNQEVILLITPLIEELKYFYNEAEMFNLNFLGESAIILWGENLKKETSFPELEEEDLRTLQILSGYPTFEEVLEKQKPVNEYYLNEIAVSYKKGCFLGQETIAKIQNFRGPSYYPVLLKVNNNFPFKKGDFEIEGRKAGTFSGVCIFEGETYILATLFRDFRLEGSIIDLGDFKAEVIFFPFFKGNTFREKAMELYHRAVECFKNNNDSLAIDLLERSTLIDKSFPDAYESLGVIRGRQGDYEAAISWMDKLLRVNPNSILAHTNKSLYLMKLGRITEAEEEKQKAIVKSFEKDSSEILLKKQEKEKKINEEKENNRRELMFRQVLDLDDEDPVANFGLGEIYFKKEKFDQAKNFLEKAINKNPKLSKAYLLLGKSFERIENISKAKDIYNEGVKVASKQGDLNVANEMRKRLTNLF